MGSLTAAQRRRLRPSQFAGPGRTYPIDTEARARSAHGRAVQYHGPGSAQDKRVERAVHKRYPGMALHYHGVHPCRGGEEHARLLGRHGEAGHERAYGEAYGLEGGQYGLASQFVRMAEGEG